MSGHLRRTPERATLPAVRALVMVVVLVGALSSPMRGWSAEADGKAKAKALFAEGQSHYALLEYLEALDAFKAAFRAYPEPTILFNIAQCHRQLGNNDQALNFLRSFKREAPDAARAAGVDDLIAQLARASAEARPRAPARPTPPASAPKTTSDGEPKPPGPVTREPVAAAPSLPEPTPAPEPTAARVVEVRAEAPSGAPRPWYRSPVGWTLAGVGVAGLVVAGALVGVAVGERNAALGATDAAAFVQHHNRSIDLQKAAWPLLGIGIAGVAVGGVVFGLSARSHR